MFVEVPKGVEALARSGANPITPADVLRRLHELALGLQQRRAGEREATLD
jgi:hypothetical protein